MVPLEIVTVGLWFFWIFNGDPQSGLLFCQHFGPTHFGANLSQKNKAIHMLPFSSNSILPLTGVPGIDKQKLGTFLDNSTFPFHFVECVVYMSEAPVVML